MIPGSLSRRGWVIYEQYGITEGTLSDSTCHNTHTHIAFSRLSLHALHRVSAYKMNPERANLPFPSPASGTPPPATPVCPSNPQHVSSTPDTNHKANSVTGTLEDVLPRLKAELHRCHVPNMPLEAFLKHFVTLEDAQCELSLLHLFSKSKPLGFWLSSYLLRLDS